MEELIRNKRNRVFARGYTTVKKMRHYDICYALGGESIDVSFITAERECAFNALKKKFFSGTQIFRYVCWVCGYLKFTFHCIFSLVHLRQQILKCVRHWFGVAKKLIVWVIKNRPNS